jgi:hypothetical protein
MQPPYYFKILIIQKLLIISIPFTTHFYDLISSGGDVELRSQLLLQVQYSSPCTSLTFLAFLTRVQDGGEWSEICSELLNNRSASTRASLGRKQE